ncbi:MAG: hypothetical protein BWY04_01493 [candidate division CPR1 bacterium ADurb.Bin160]|uniref:Uncharacterized protein n=1 Tax=candidate division CPR1 bacterium ADurb.Bin160 TaxID=1852826 RepID=A0A1V5ZIH9_9BACT|nr:MAG: hypothetical protein BWY04_01493 [candidate division CPR1 bacterium ADurb.Bin160]
MKLALMNKDEEMLLFTPDETKFILNLLHYAINMEKDTYELAKEIAKDKTEDSINSAMDVLFDHRGESEKEVIYNIIQNKHPRVMEMVNCYKGD